jgi:hypothetical protein
MTQSVFPSESVLKFASGLLRDVERGKLTREHAFSQVLELNPLDYPALVELAQLRLQSGDAAGAEEYLWRAIESQPCAYMAFMQMFNLKSDARPPQHALAAGLAELGYRKLLLDEEAVESEALDIPLPVDDPELKDLSPRERLQLMAGALARVRDTEPVAVTAQLRPHRLVQQLQESEDLPAPLIDALVAEGESIVPLLVGVLRGYAHGILNEDDSSIAENTLALLGEIGDADAIPQLLEFVAVRNPNLSGAARWAIDRIAALNPEAAARTIGEIASDVPGTHRLSLAEALMRHPGLDPEGRLFERLLENPGKLDREDAALTYPVLLLTAIAARGRAGAELARKALRKWGGTLQRGIVRKCEDAIESIPIEETPPPMADTLGWTVYQICAGEADWPDEDDGEEADEEDLYTPEPVRRKVTPERNDPCWCGSGKKYKKCHLEADQQTPDAPAPAAAPEGAFDGLRTRVAIFRDKEVPDDGTRTALKEFFGEVGTADPESIAAFADWMIHDWVFPRFGRPVMEEFQRRHAATLNAAERDALDSWTSSYVGLYEVLEVRPGVGVELRDFTSDDKLFVHDVRMSNVLTRWDGLHARVVNGERGREFTGLGTVVPRHLLARLFDWVKEDRERSGLEWPVYFKRNWPRIRREGSQLGKDWIDSVQLKNSDGEELMMSRAVYQVLDRNSLTAALRKCPELNAEDKYHYAWLRGDKLLGNIAISNGQLSLEANSRERLERGKSLLAGVAGSKMLRHKRDEHTTQRELKRSAAQGASEPSRREEIPLEIQHQAITQYMEKHYAAWPDMQLPALGGKTPRQAVQTADGRRKVIMLLRDFENGEERKRKSGEPFYDIGRVRTELGVEE